jgi:hypothetical protein
MRVFLSWSGPKSRAVAEALRDWLPKVIQSVRPFMSQVDISAGTRPMAEIESQLESCKFGIICVSADNWTRPWLNFEAGAISKRLGLAETRVAPLLIDMKPEDIDSPLKQFQMKTLDRAGVFEVVASLNALSDDPLTPEFLRDTYEVWWPRLEPRLQELDATPAQTAVEQRGIEDKVDEMLRILRSIGTNLSGASAAFNTRAPSGAYVVNISTPDVMNVLVPKVTEDIAELGGTVDEASWDGEVLRLVVNTKGDREISSRVFEYVQTLPVRVQLVNAAKYQIRKSRRPNSES